MIADTGFRRVRIALFFLGLIGTLICWLKGSPEPAVHCYWLLPLIFGFLHLLVKKIYKYEAGMGLLIFEIIAFLRYVVTPVVTCIIHKYDGHVWATTNLYTESVFYMVFELVVVYLVMYFLIPYVNKKRIIEHDSEDNVIYLGKFGVIKAIIVVCFALILISNAPIRDMLFNFNVTSEDVSNITYTLSEYRSQIPGEYLIVYYLGLIIIYVQVLKIIKENRILSDWMKFVFVVIASMAYVSCGWSNGKSVSRWSILAAVLAMVYVLLYFFPKRRKFIAISGTVTVIFAILLGTFYKRIAHGMSLSFWEAFETYLTPSALNEYFAGVFPVGNGINSVMQCTNGRISTFLYDTVANIPKLLSMLGILGESTATFFGQNTGHVEIIIPNIAMSYYVFSFLGFFVYTAVLAWLMVVAQTKMKTSFSLYKRLMLFQIVFWCALSMAVNVQIIQTNCWKYVIGLILITMDERISIRLRTRRS